MVDEIRAKPDGCVLPIASNVRHQLTVLIAEDFSSHIWAVSIDLDDFLIDGKKLTPRLAAAGTSPGRLVETDNQFNIIAEHPKDVKSNLNILADKFNPHGLTVDWDKNIILTSDFIVPLSILKPSLGKISDNTLRLWNLADRSIISTILIPDVSSYGDSIGDA